MEYRPLGNTDVSVSVICLGTMTYGEQNDSADAHAQLDEAVAQGVNFVDTAEIYSAPMRETTSGSTETMIGEWLAKRGRREDIVLATKISGPAGKPEPNKPLPMHWIRGGKTRHNREHIAAAIDSSLRRLRTDYIDLYQLHWPDRNTNFFGSTSYQHDAEEEMTPLAETLEALGEAVKAGKIRHIGLSNETPWGLAECLHLAKTRGLPCVVSVQNPYNLLNRTYEIGMAEISAREQCGLLVYSPLAFGVLTGKYMDGTAGADARLNLFPGYARYTTDKAKAAVKDYVELARKRGVSPTQMAIAFTIQQSFVTSSIIGATTLPQLRENLAAADFVIDDEMRAELSRLGNKHYLPCP